MTDERHPIRVVIADQQAIFRHSLRMTLESAPGIHVVADVSDAPGVVKLIREQNPDILLLDLALPGRRELQLNKLSSIRTVILLANVDKPRILESFRLGARGVVLKSAGQTIFVEGIQSVMAGQYWLDGESLKITVDALRELLENSISGTSARDYGLTRRELDIISKIADGRSNKEVGEEFAISERTVKHHLTNIFSKVGVSSRLQLALFAVNHDLKSNREPAVALHSLQTDAEI